ncbi:MAG: glutamate transport system substrate-binding protein [Actinomycetota bacterium]|jgi:glutamate transport system substrate-binding protein|nr:glutamate transport system substrate-binding protein [Actinomycetota bacterium]
MGHTRKTFVAGLAVAALAVSGCGSGTSGNAGAPKVANKPSFEAGTTMATIAAHGTMKVGTKFDQPGFGLKGLNGKVEGFDVEVAKIIAGALGVSADKIEYVESPSKVREELIEKGTVDLVAATYTINDKRKKRITFAGPYYVAGQQLMVKTANTKLKGPADLKANPDQKVCSVTGSTPSEQIKPYLASPGQLVLFDVYDKCANALRTDQVAAVTTDNVILLGFVSKSKGTFKLVGSQFTKEPYGIGIKKGDVKFCEFIDKTLKANVAAYKKAWADTAGKAAGATTPELPPAAPCA